METFIVGRLSSSGGVDIAVPPTEDTVGRRHAELQVRPDGSCTIRDLGSANGTFVNERGRWSRVTSANVSLHQEIRLGDYFTTVSQLLAMQGIGGSFDAGYQPAPQAPQPLQANPLPVYHAATYDPHAAGAYAAHAGNQPTNEPLAIWSFVLALLSLFCCGGLTAIPAVICGHLALSRIGKPARKAGRGLAIAGLIIGYLGIVWFLLVLIWFLFLGGLGLLGLAAAGA